MIYGQRKAYIENVAIYEKNILSNNYYETGLCFVNAWKKHNKFGYGLKYLKVMSIIILNSSWQS